MQRTLMLTRSVLASIASAAARPGPSTIAAATSAIQTRTRSGLDARRTWCAVASTQRVRLEAGLTTAPKYGRAVVLSRSVSSSAARSNDESRDRPRFGNADDQRAPTEQAPPNTSTTEPIAQPSSSSHSPEDGGASKSFPVSSSSLDEATPFPPAPPSEKQSGSSSDPIPPSASTNPFLDRLRSAASSLPKYDALASSAALSSAIETATVRVRALTSSLRTKLSTLSAQYNTYSGYAAIEELKARITQLETSLDSARSLATAAKKTYLLAVQNRSASQRETNDLLSRKNSWSEADLSRYTELLRKEHALSREEGEAEKELERSEAEVQGAFDELMKAVMVRYHEEQIWSDRMRGWSTYGSLVVAGLNAFLFILAILLVEPYKRKKLAQTFESRLVAAEEQSRQLILASVEQFQHSLNAALAAPSPPLAPAPAPEPEPPIPAPPTMVQPEPEQEPVAPQPPLAFEPAREEARRRREEEERLVFASTVGVVVGAALSLLISMCWS